MAYPYYDDPEQQALASYLMAQGRPDQMSMTGREAGTMAGSMVPGTGLMDALGIYPAGDEGFEPSLRENIGQGNYANALFQMLGAGGDLAMATGVGVPVGMTMKTAAAAGKGAKAASKAGKAAEAASSAVRAGDIGFDPRYDIVSAGKPRVGEVDRLQNLTANVSERGTQNAPQVSLMDFLGRPFITSMADRTRAGGVLEGVNNVMFNRPVNLQGGQGFMFENPGMVWASGYNPVEDIQELAATLKKETGQNPIYLPWQMAPSGGDFASMTGETMLAYADASMPKSIKKNLDKQIKALIPDWKGVSNPESVEQFRGARDVVRKKIKKQILDKNFRNQGGLNIGEARLAVGDPGQYSAQDGGLMNVGEIFAGQPGIMQSGHPAYPMGVPGQGLGQLKEDVRVFQLLQNAAKARAMPDPRNPSRPDLRSLEMKPYGGVITEGLLRQLGF